MKRPEYLRFVKSKHVVLIALMAFLAVSATHFSSNFPNILLPFVPDTPLASEQQTCLIDGVWRLSLAMPGGSRESILVLTARGETISGTMTNPGAPEDIHAIYNGTCRNGSYTLSVDIGRITYHMEGSCNDNRLSFNLTTRESILLDVGHRLNGNTGEISGRYLVPVYSPGGIMENHFELAAENGKITGRMYVPVSGNETSPNRPDAVPPGMEAPSGAPTPGGFEAISGDKRDINIFHGGTYVENRISLYTRTAQGSLFHFSGTVEGNIIRLAMHVTDLKKDLEAFRVE